MSYMPERLRICSIPEGSSKPGNLEAVFKCTLIRSVLLCRAPQCFSCRHELLLPGVNVDGMNLGLQLPLGEKKGYGLATWFSRLTCPCPDQPFFHVHDTKQVDQRHPDPGTIMADPTKAETEQVFKILKAQKGNKVRQNSTEGLTSKADNVHRLALTVKLAIPHGPASHSVSTFA